MLRTLGLLAGEKEREVWEGKKNLERTQGEIINTYNTQIHKMSDAVKNKTKELETKTEELSPNIYCTPLLSNKVWQAIQ